VFFEISEREEVKGAKKKLHTPRYVLVESKGVGFGRALGPPALLPLGCCQQQGLHY
jgi:hypothetical protein